MQDSKYQQIIQDKLELNKLIDNAEEIINTNIKIMLLIMDYHKEFISFIEMMSIYELYKWETLKYDYKMIKAKYNKDKKMFKDITKLYGNIITYYTIEENATYNKCITVIGSINDNMTYAFLQLHKIHNDCHLKCKHLMKNPQIIKIYNKDTNLDDIMIRIYKNYYGLKLMNKLYNTLKIDKLNLTSEVK
jgi:hypothetical protein